MNRQLIQGVVLALTLAANNLFAAEKLQIGFPALATALSPPWVTAGKGFWGKYGLDVDLIYLAGETTVQALVGGSIQLAIGSDPDTTMAIMQGAKLVRLGVTTNSLGSSLVTQQGINSFQELKGKTIGIAGRGLNSLELRLSQLLRENGIDPKRDVKFLSIGGAPSARVAAIQKGVIVGAMITPPYDLAAQKQGLKIFSQIDVPLFAGGINTTLAFEKNNRETLVRFLKGYMEGIHYMVTHRSETLNVFSSYLRQLDAATLNRFYDEISGRVEKGLRPDPRSVRFMLDFVALNYPQAKQLTEKDHWDLTLLEEVHQSGFLEQLYKK